MATVEPMGYRWKLFYYHYKYHVAIGLSLVFLIGGLCFFVYNKKVTEHASLKEESRGRETRGSGERVGNMVREEEPNMKVDSVGKGRRNPDVIQIVITFTNADKNHNLKTRFGKCVESIIKRSSVPINFNIMGDAKSHKIAGDILEEFSSNFTLHYEVVYHTIDDITRNVLPIIEKLQSHFSSKTGSYYNNPLFFISTVLHLALSHERVIMLDSDLIFQADIHELYGAFRNFTSDQMIGIAHEQQPVYRHTFHQYRDRNHGTRVGDPPPSGLTGFNSGVLLLDLGKLRRCAKYNKLLDTPSLITNICDKFGFQGHLGDQDFYSLLEMEEGEYGDMFHVLPCSWNRQLCRWWEKGYKDVFHLYHNCEGHINVWHGNCNTPIPVEP